MQRVVNNDFWHFIAENSPLAQGMDSPLMKYIKTTSFIKINNTDIGYSATSAMKAFKVQQGAVEDLGVQKEKKQVQWTPADRREKRKVKEKRKES